MKVNHKQHQLARACNFIDSYYYLPLDLDQISRQAHFSRYHFIRLFRQAYQLTPHQYLIYKRIEKAKTLLITTETTITEICFAVGFQSLGSFSTLFNKSIGQSPKAYRESRRKVAQRFIPHCYTFMFGISQPH